MLLTGGARKIYTVKIADRVKFSIGDSPDKCCKQRHLAVWQPGCTSSGVQNFHRPAKPQDNPTVLCHRVQGVTGTVEEVPSSSRYQGGSVDCRVLTQENAPVVQSGTRGGPNEYCVLPLVNHLDSAEATLKLGEVLSGNVLTWMPYGTNGLKEGQN